MPRVHTTATTCIPAHTRALSPSRFNPALRIQSPWFYTRPLIHTHTHTHRRHLGIRAHLTAARSCRSRRRRLRLPHAHSLFPLARSLTGSLCFVFSSFPFACLQLCSGFIIQWWRAVLNCSWTDPTVLNCRGNHPPHAGARWTRLLYVDSVQHTHTLDTLMDYCWTSMILWRAVRAKSDFDASES